MSTRQGQLPLSGEVDPALGEQLWFGATTLGPWGLHPLSLAFLASGSLMISTIRIPKL